MSTDTLTADLAHSLDRAAFAQDRLKFHPDLWQADLLRSEDRQVILNCSRQAGKSTATSILALHTAHYQPGALVLLISPSQRQSRELFAKVMAYNDMLVPVQALEEDNRLSATLANGSRIVSLPGDARTIRGFSAPTLVIEDEAAFVDDDVNAALRPMLAVSRGRLVLLSTPFGRRGHFFDAWEKGGASWKRIRVPASACPRIDPDYLAQEQEAMTAWRFRQEFGCEFVETDDQVFGYDLVRAAFDDTVQPLFSTDQLALLGARGAPL